MAKWIFGLFKMKEKRTPKCSALWERVNIQKSNVKALNFLRKGIMPTASTSIADTTEYGYGDLDDNGFWQYRLDVEDK
jgi:hypothetical protein